MDSLQDNSKSNADSSEKNDREFQDPMIRENYDSGAPGKQAQPAEIVQSAKRTSSADSTLSPAQYVAMPQGTQNISSAGDIIKSILRFKLTILLVFLFIAVPAVIAIWKLVVPKYRAQGQVRVRPIIPYLVFPTEESGKIPLYEAFVNTQVSIILSDTVLQRVLDMSEVQQTQWYKNPPETLMTRLRGSMPPHIDRLRDALSVRPIKDTEIIDVAFIDTSAKEAQLIVNSVLRQFINYIRSTSGDDQLEIKTQLKRQLDSLDTRIKELEISAAFLSKKLNTTDPEELISSKKLRLEETQARLSQVQQNIDLLNWEIRQATTKDSNDLSATAAADSNDVPAAAAADGNDVTAVAIERLRKQPKYYEDDEWRRLDNNVKSVQLRIEMSRITPNHPKAVQSQKELEFAQEQLRQREQQLRDRLSNTTGSSIAAAQGLSYEEVLIYLQHQLARSEREQTLLEAELQNQQKEFNDLFADVQSLEKMNKDLLERRELFSTVRQRLDAKDMESNAPGSIDILTTAMLPVEPYYDRRIAFTFMVIVLALGAGCGLAYLQAGKTQVIYTPKDMPHPMKVSFLGYLPLAPSALTPDRMPDPATVESIRVVRTALFSRLNGRSGATVLITSAAEGTGKSTFTMLLGESLARSGKKVLMIDADFRKMTLTKLFNLSGTPGFIQTLCDRSQEEYYIFKTEQIPGMSFMPAGKQIDYNPAFDQTSNGCFSVHMNRLRKRYNFILLDSPPVLPVADAVILSSQVDGIIIVERELVSHQKQINNALARLASAGGHLLGTVFIGSGSQKNYG